MSQLDRINAKRFVLKVDQNVKHIAKGNLPEKPCVNCKRPMVWRKSWAKNWDAVKYCSDRCSAEAKTIRTGSKKS